MASYAAIKQQVVPIPTGFLSYMIKVGTCHSNPPFPIPPLFLSYESNKPLNYSSYTVHVASPRRLGAFDIIGLASAAVVDPSLLPCASLQRWRTVCTIHVCASGDF